jgi:hypothetical protein
MRAVESASSAKDGGLTGVCNHPHKSSVNLPIVVVSFPQYQLLTRMGLVFNPDIM